MAKQKAELAYEVRQRLPKGSKLLATYLSMETAVEMAASVNDGFTREIFVLALEDGTTYKLDKPSPIFIADMRPYQ